MVNSELQKQHKTVGNIDDSCDHERKSRFGGAKLEADNRAEYHAKINRGISQVEHKQLMLRRRNI